MSRSVRGAAPRTCAAALLACWAGLSAAAGVAAELGRHEVAAAPPATAVETPPGRTVTAADFAGWEAGLLRDGKLRTERSPADAPVSNAALVEHFGRIALRIEGSANGGRTEHRLHRRETPVRWWAFARGEGARRAGADVAQTFARVARLTGLDIRPAESAAGANFYLLFLDADDYGAAAGWARRVLGGRDAELIAEFRTRRTLCTASVVIGRRDRRRDRALVLVRAGYSDLLRLGCVQEEVAQALGLPNDDPDVRPSVFNDDEEFALLTEHDELLLRILYDPRLRHGMTADQAMPVVARIVEELRPGG